ncbi:MAG: entericidin A/B family lipoprotein [Burkholderiales bacterium]|nr:entericidin A/B family lipoprotein [Burkholderiales bacterium]
MKKIITLLAIVAIAISASACNTVQGIGKDVKKAGEVVEGAAKK